MDVHDLIRTKRATRVFLDRTMADDAIRRILNAGRRAQSSKNSQPWSFVAVRERRTLAQLAECGRYAGHLAGAAFAVGIVASEAGSRWSVAFDLGQAAAYMQLAAWELGIGSCIASIYEPDRARAILGIPPEFSFEVAISFGYPAPEPRRPTVVRGGRRPFDDVVHWERW